VGVNLSRIFALGTAQIWVQIETVTFGLVDACADGWNGLNTAALKVSDIGRSTKCDSPHYKAGQEGRM